MAVETEIEVVGKSYFEKAIQGKGTATKIKVADIKACKRVIAIVKGVTGLSGVYLTTKDNRQYVADASVFNYKKFVKGLQEKNPDIQDEGTKLLGFWFMFALMLLVVIGAVTRFWLKVCNLNKTSKSLDNFPKLV